MSPFLNRNVTWRTPQWGLKNFDWSPLNGKIEGVQHPIAREEYTSYNRRLPQDFAEEVVGANNLM